MLSTLEITNFKSHKNTPLCLGNLTLLCGENGVGKSSVIQALLLLRQTYQKNRLQEGLELNKPLCEIGSATDLFYQYAEENIIGIQFGWQQQQLSWKFTFDENKTNATFLEVEDFKGDFAGLKDISLFNNAFQYLSASRLAPRESYPRDDYEVEKKRQLSIEKGQGELVAHFLHHHSDRERNIIEVAESLQNKHNKHPDLLSQTTAWEREISKNVNVKVVSYGTSYAIKYNFDVEGGDSTNDFSAENVGFGLSYALPVIVALLAAPKDSLILIENPEAHLHPYGQAKLAELMCLAAQAGIQVIVETHSDHILNGTLVASKKGKIDKENIKIWSFDRDEQEHAVKATEVKVLEGGKIDQQPAGFFDQMEKDLEDLMGF